MLLSNFPLIESRNFDYTEDLGRGFFKYRNIRLVGRTPRDYFYRINSAQLGNLALGYAEYSATMDFDVGEHDDWYFAVIRWSGHDDYFLAGQKFSISAGGFGVVPPRMPLRVITQANGRSLIVRFDRLKLEREMARLLDRDKIEPLRFGQSQSLRDKYARSFTRFAKYIAVEMNRPDSFIHMSKLASSQAAAALTTLLLEGHPVNRNKTLLMPIKVGSAYHLRRVEEFIRSNLNQPLTMGDIAAVAGTSASTLYELFRRHRNCAPMQFVRRLRLEAVRRDLIANSMCSVTEAAYRWGFLHLGRFAHHYHRAFGEHPSETRRRR